MLQALALTMSDNVPVACLHLDIEIELSVWQPAQVQFEKWGYIYLGM